MSSKTIVHQNGGHQNGGGTPIRARTKYGHKVIGQVSGQCYEKKLKSTGILRNPPAIALSVGELHQAEAAGAKFLRVQATDTGETFAIDLAMFRYFSFPVDRGYGRQIGCTLDHFGKTARIAERNPIVDNPKQGPGPGYERPQPAQLPLFRMSPRYNLQGEYIGEGDR